VLLKIKDLGVNDISTIDCFIEVMVILK